MRTSRIFSIASVCLLVFVVYGTSFAKEKKSIDYYSDPQAVIDQVSSRGAREVVLELYDDDNVWYALLRNIATGSESWLKAAVALRSGSYAGASEMLDLAVGEALEHAPANVLRIAPRVFLLRSVCGGPDVDDRRYDSYELSMNVISLRMKRVAAITDPDLKKLCDQCIKYLERSKKGIASFYEVKYEQPVEIDKTIKDATRLLEQAYDGQIKVHSKLQTLTNNNNTYLTKIEVILVLHKENHSEKLQSLLGQRYFIDQNITPTIIGKIAGSGHGNDLEFLYFEPLPNRSFGTFTLIPIKMEVEGKKENLISFFNSIADFTIISTSSFIYKKVD